MSALEDAVRRLVFQLFPDTYCVVCGADTGEGIPHEDGCVLAGVIRLLDGAP